MYIYIYIYRERERDTYMCIYRYTYIYIYIYMYVYIYIYIYTCILHLVRGRHGGACRRVACWKAQRRGTAWRNAHRASAGRSSSEMKRCTVTLVYLPDRNARSPYTPSKPQQRGKSPEPSGSSSASLGYLHRDTPPQRVLQRARRRRARGVLARGSDEGGPGGSRRRERVASTKPA